ncbi:unnamed protein product [Pedinophyceae sp. YPF-701]|nr:unnamed protein product [Pedinophyceae sp. YPF-701]
MRRGRFRKFRRFRNRGLKAAMEINTSIVKSETLRDLLHVCERHEAEFNQVNRATAVCHLCKLTVRSRTLPPQRAAAVRTALRITAEALARRQQGELRLGVREMANMLYGHALVGNHVLGLARRRRRRLAARGGRDADAYDSESDSEDIALLAAYGNMSDVQLSAMRILEAIGNTPKQELLDSGNPQELANIVWAAAKLELQGPLAEHAVGCVLGVCLEKLPSFTCRDVSNVAWGLATLSSGGPWLCIDVGVVRALGEEVLRGGKLDRAVTQDLSNLLWALATMGVPPRPLALQRIVEAAGRSAAKFKPQELSNTLWALATLGYQSDREVVVHLATSMARSEATLADAAPQAICNTLWATATMGVVLPEEDLRALVDAVLSPKRAPACSTYDICSVAWVAAKLRWWPGNAAMSRMAEIASEMFSQMNAREIATISYCWAALGYNPGRSVTLSLMGAARDLVASPDHLRQWSLGDLASVMWGAVVLGGHDDSFWWAMCRATNRVALQTGTIAVARDPSVVASIDEAVEHAVADSGSFSPTGSAELEEHMDHVNPLCLLADAAGASREMRHYLSVDLLGAARRAWRVSVASEARSVGQTRAEMSQWAVDTLRAAVEEATATSVDDTPPDDDADADGESAGGGTLLPVELWREFVDSMPGRPDRNIIAAAVGREGTPLERKRLAVVWAPETRLWGAAAGEEAQARGGSEQLGGQATVLAMDLETRGWAAVVVGGAGRDAEEELRRAAHALVEGSLWIQRAIVNEDV